MGEFPGSAETMDSHAFSRHGSTNGSQGGSLAAFVPEGREHLRRIERALLALEQAPGDAQALDALLGAIRMIDESSGSLQLERIWEFTRAMQAAVEQTQADGVQIGEELLVLLLDCAEHLSLLLACLEDGEHDALLESARAAGVQLLERLKVQGAGGARVAEAGTGSMEWHISARFGRDVLHHGMDPLSFIRYLSTLGEVVSVTTLFDAMPEPSEMDPEACYLGLEIRFRGAVDRQAIEGAFEYVRDDSAIRILPPDAPPEDYLRLIGELPEDAARLGELLVASGALTRDELELGMARQKSGRAQAGDVVAPVIPAREAPKATPAPKPQIKLPDNRSIRVHAAKVDELINLLGELVIASAGVSLRARRDGNSEVLDAAANMARLVEEVRDSALTLRMVPIGETFNRFRRMVHDLARELGKEVELTVSGADTELDKSMVEQLSDPLMHLLRNALDHGIEAPQHRLLNGKPARGRLMLNAYHEMGSMVVQVADDGVGLDREKILARAQESGLVRADQLLTEPEIFQLVMEPGFSTARTLTSVSGRGVGMDVVRRNVEALRGSVTVDSVAQQGTVVSLRVPLTLAIIDGFLVGVSRSTYVLPLETVVECLELSRQDRVQAMKSGHINLRGKVLPVLRLRDVFEATGEPGRRENVVVVDYGGQQAGLLVDALFGEFQTVIKPLGKLFERLAGISGSTILGSGEVALIVDVPALVQRAVLADAGRQAGATGEERTETRL